MKIVTTLVKKVWIQIPMIVLVFFVFIPNVTLAQSEEDVLNSIGSELDDESAKEKEAAKIDKEYKALKSKAEASYKAKKYDKAKEYYSQMLKLKPDSDFAQSRLNIIDQKLAAEKEAAAQKKYDALIAQGDALLASEKWSEATAKYKSAASLMPDEAYPKSQLQKMAKLQADAKIAAELAAAQKKYDGLIAKADADKANQNWEEARKNYTLAANAKPSETYPKEQLALLDKLQQEAEANAAQAALDRKYTTLITGADAALEAKKWAEAKQKYKLAMETKPGEAYAKSQYNKVDALEAEYLAKKEQIKIDAEYKAQVQAADQLFNTKKWKESVTAYKLAQGIKTNETYPKTQITKAETRIAEELDMAMKAEQLESDFQKHKKLGEEALAKENWLGAIESFTAAKVLKPQNTVVVGLLNQAKSGKKTADDLALKEKSLAEAAAKIQNQFDSEIAIGTQAMKNKNWESARNSFNKAKKLKPEESVPDEKLAELTNLIEKEKTELLAIEEQKKAEAAAEKARLEDEARIAAEKEAAEKERLAEEKKVAAAALAAVEANRIAEEAAEKARVEEAKRIAEEKAAVEEARLAEEAKVAAVAAKAAEAEKLALEAEKKSKLEEEAKLAAEQAAKEKAEKEEAARVAAEIALAAEAKQKSDELAEKQRLANEEKLAAEKLAQEEEARKEEERVAEEKANEKANALMVKMESEFNQAVEDYKQAISINDWSSSAAAIATAEAIYPGEKKVSAMKSELQRLQQAQEEALALEADNQKKAKDLEDKYQELITQGDQGIANKNYAQAVKNFQEAKNIKPSEQYPNTKLAEIKELQLAANVAELEKQKELDEKYGALMAKGESALQIKNWEEAQSSFEEAQKLKPENTGPKERIQEMHRLLQKEKELAEQAEALDEDYTYRMKNGQLALDKEQFADAKRFFMGAYKLKPKEELPQEKLAETERLWALFIEAEKVAAESKKAEELEKNYNGFILSGDKAFENQLWDDAIQAYQGATKLKPDEQYPLERLKLSKSAKSKAVALAAQKQKEEEERLRAEQEERLRLQEEANALAELEGKFKLAVSTGDDAMGREDYKTAVSAYKKASELKPKDNEVADKWAEAVVKFKQSEAERLAEEKERRRLAAIELEKRKEAARFEREAYLKEIQKNSPEELAKAYEDGLTEESEEIDDTMVTKSIIVEKGEGRYLLRFDYPWGEHFYYLNGKKIREDTYNWNIRKYKF